MKRRFWAMVPAVLVAGTMASADMGALNEQIRRDKFDTVLPRVMQQHDIDMWIHVMREEVPDAFGSGEFGSQSGVFVFTDRGDGRIERAVLGRRWGARQRDRVATEYVDPIRAFNAYDIVADAVRIQEPPTGPVTEYDLRFQGLYEFVKARDPARIAVNYRHKLGQWPTFVAESDGISHTDFVLLSEELGDEYASRIVSSEFLQVAYSTQRVDSEIEWLKQKRKQDLTDAYADFERIVPGVSRSDEIPFATLRRMRPGLSQRGRSAGWENSTVQGGDVLLEPDLGLYAYVLREGETEPPAEVHRLWQEYLKVDAILADTIRAGLTPRQIMANYASRFDEAGIVLRVDQLHMIQPKNVFSSYAAGYESGKTHLTIDSHGQVKGARPLSDETYFGPRIGSYGPEWVIDMPLPENHHFVIEYFFYMPSPAPAGEDQYLLWWNHEEAIATEDGIEYLSPPQKELILIPSTH